MSSGKVVSLILKVNDDGSAVVDKFSENTIDKIQNMHSKSSSALEKLTGWFHKLGAKIKESAGFILDWTEKIGGMVLKIGGLIGAVTGLAGAFSFERALKEFAGFEGALVDMGKVTNQSFTEIRANIMALPSSLGSATELMQGYYATISAGVTEPAKAMDLLQTAAKAAKAAHVDLFSTIEGLTKLMNAYQGQLTSTSEAADLLFAIEKEGQTTFQELIPIIGSVASISKEVGVNQKEMAASLAMISQTAGSTANAATYYRSILVSLMKPTEDMSKAFQAAGYESGQAAINSLGFSGALKIVYDSAGGSIEKLGDLFGREEALLGISALAANGFTSLGQKIDAMGQSAGTTEAAFDRWKASLQGLWDTVKNSLGKQLILIGEQLAPKVKVLVEAVSELLEKYRDPITKEFGEWLDLIYTRVMDLVPRIKEVVGHFVEWYKNEKEILKNKLDDYLKNMVFTLDTLGKRTDPLVNMAKAILALINAFDWLADKIASAGAAIIIMADKINAKIQSVVAWVDTIREKLVNFLNGVGIPKTALDFVVNFWGTGSATLPISEKIDAINAELTQLNNNVSTANPDYVMDASQARSSITTVQTEFDDLNMHVSQNPLTVTVDTSQAVESLQKLAEQHAKVMAGWDQAISSIQGLPQVTLAAGQAKRDADVAYANQFMDKQIYGTPEEQATATQLLAELYSPAGKVKNSSTSSNTSVYGPITNPYGKSQEYEISGPASGGSGGGQVIFDRVHDYTKDNYGNPLTPEQAKDYYSIPYGKYALGTSYVPKTGTYLLHQGESVVPKGNNGGSKNTTIGDININISGDQSPQSGEDYRTIVRNFIIPELQRLGAI